MILMYHKVSLTATTKWWVDANEFYRQMVEISSKEVVYLEDYDVNNPNHVVITFDGIYQNVVKYAMPILKHFNYPFELFLTSDYIGKDNSFDTIEPLCDFTTEKELIELVESGGRLQWHTRTHPNLKNLTDVEKIILELNIPDELVKLDPKGFDWFAYPYGEFNEKIKSEVEKRFNGAVSCNQGNDSDKYILNRITVFNNTKLNNNKVSCIIASYNYGDFLVEAIESVLHQTIRPDEILISDDFSDDDTRIIGEAYTKKYPGLIKFQRNEFNMGIVDHFNKAISLTFGDYIFFLGADNRLTSNYIEDCISVLDKDEKMAIAYTDYALFGQRAKLVYDNFSKEKQGAVRADEYYQIHFPEFETREQLLDEISVRNFIQGSSMFKRKAFDEAGGYMKSNSAEDYNLFKRIIDKGWDAKKAKNTNLEYRQHNFFQANNVVGLHQKVLLYKSLYEQKSSFEKTRLYKTSFYLHKGIRFVKKNYSKPRKLINGLKFILKKIK